MDPTGDKSHPSMPSSLHNPQGPGMGNPLPTTLANQLSGAKTVEAENLDMIAQIQELLNQLYNRGFNSMLVTVGPLGEIGVHGSLKGQTFVKDNVEIIDRFSKMCNDDVWTLIGVQKRFLEIGRANQNKAGVFNDKGDYPLDFSHERGNYFPSNQQSENRSGSHDNNFVQGIISQGLNQGKNYQPSSFVPSSFTQYMSDSRPPTYPSVSFFQGGFSQGANSGESYPQSFMPGLDSSTNKENFGNIGNSVMPGSVATTTASSMSTLSSSDKPGISQAEDDLLKEMLTNTAIHEVFKDAGGKTSSKEKSSKKANNNTTTTETSSSSESKKKDGSEKRKRERHPETWQRNIKKKLKTEGKAYINAKGKLVPAKILRPVDCSKCKLKCSDKISEDTRQKIFNWFWKLGSYTAQKEFVVSRVTQVATKTSKRRHVHRLFSFEINGKYEPVCKPFFSRTLGIGDSYIYKAFEQKARDLFVTDGRGKHAPVNKTSQDQVDFMHQHLDRFLAPYPESKPLPKNIHAVKWYDEYVKFCEDNEKKFVSKHIYRKIFQEYVRKYPPNPYKKKPGEAQAMSTESESQSDSEVHVSQSHSHHVPHTLPGSGKQMFGIMGHRN